MRDGIIASMNMSVTSFDRAVLTDWHEFDAESCGAANHVQAMAPWAWPLEGCEIGRCYFVGDARTKRIGSSVEAYTEWIARLVKDTSGAVLDEVWEDPTDYREIPFFELATFVFGERGVMGWTVATRIAHEFQTQLPQLAKTWRATPHLTPFLLTWYAIFENASYNEGIVLYT